MHPPHRLNPIQLLVFAFLLAALPAAAQYQLVWQDEFDGTTLDLGKWTPQIGDGCPSLCGWGNNELEYYRAENATVSGGFLTITAKEETVGGRDYTSARLRTKDLGDWTYGRFEMRAKMPVGQGMWPAFWMLPTDGVYGIWAASGEIDIMEYLGHDPDVIHGTIHYGDQWPGNQSSGGSYDLTPGNFNDDFHTFALEWESCEMRWYVDDILYSTKNTWYSAGEVYPAPFDQRFHLLLNLAVGGNWPGPPDGSTVFPQELVVDYVRVYQLPGPDLSTCIKEFDGMDHGDPLGNGWFQFNGSVGGGGIGGDLSDLPPVDAGCASLSSGWGSGGTPGFVGGFGRRNPTDLTGFTHFTMWINPDPGQDYILEINLNDDDNGDDFIPSSPDGQDDEFQYLCQVSPTGPHAISGGGWQRLDIPLSAFTDDNSYHWGGNGVFDPFPTSVGGNGQLVNMVIAIIGSGTNVNFRTDRWAFTQQTASIAGRVWDDADESGTQNGGETGTNGVTVELYDALLGTLAATTVTAGSGDYNFPTLLGGQYEVRVDPTTLPTGSIATFDPDGIGTLDTFDKELACDEAAAANNFGYASSAIGVPLDPARLQPLRQNAPNPFSPRTQIAFELAEPGAAEVTVYDSMGRRIKTLLSGALSEGPHRVEWRGDDNQGRQVAGGIYYYALRTDRGRWVRRMTLIR